MIKYDNKLIMDYLNCNEIEEYNVEELENDYDFMYQVINISNDKQMYNFCSDKLKKDYKLVKYLINKYNDDLKYIENIADNFLETVENELERIEILIIMDNYFKKENKTNKYNIMLSAIYSSKRVEIEIYKLSSDDTEFNDELGMGFLWMYDNFNQSKLIIDFFASKTIEAIISEYDIHLEEYLHNKYNDFQIIEKQGINNFLIRFLSEYDVMLSSYLNSNIQLLNPLVEKLNKIKLNWTKYNRRQDFKNYNDMLDEIEQYMEEYGYDCNYSEISILCYLSIKFGVGDKIKEYYGINEEIYNDIINSLNDTFNELPIEINDIRHIENIKTIMEKYLNKNRVESSNKKEIKKSSKILEFKSKK